MDRTEEPDAADVCVRACVRTCVRACVCVCHSDQLRRLVGFAGDVARSLYREHLGTKVRQKKGKGGGVMSGKLGECLGKSARHRRGGWWVGSASMLAGHICPQKPAFPVAVAVAAKSQCRFTCGSPSPPLAHALFPSLPECDFVRLRRPAPIPWPGVCMRAYARVSARECARARAQLGSLGGDRPPI